jgi:hypothetical protein
VIIIRRVGAAMLAAAAIAIWFLMAPAEPETRTLQGVSDRDSDISEAMSNYTMNEYTASSAPQQQVVNGWVAKDLLEIIAKQQNDALTRDLQSPPVAPSDERIPALAGLLVLGLALALVTSQRPRVEDGNTTNPSEPNPHATAAPAIA